VKGLHALQYMEEYLKQIKVRKIEKIPYDPHNVISQLTVLKKKSPCNYIPNPKWEKIANMDS